ncbi:unnamed protein product [Ectocarpus fasciculatus]
MRTEAEQLRTSRTASGSFRLSCAVQPGRGTTKHEDGVFLEAKRETRLAFLGANDRRTGKNKRRTTTLALVTLLTPLDMYSAEENTVDFLAVGFRESHPSYTIGLIVSPLCSVARRKSACPRRRTLTRARAAWRFRESEAPSRETAGPTTVSHKANRDKSPQTIIGYGNGKPAWRDPSRPKKSRIKFHTPSLYTRKSRERPSCWPRLMPFFGGI